jgi:putative FmdB family regulatory protein
VPTYQYACTQCGHGFEAVQSFSDSALTECPECEGRLRKVFSSVGIVFKGSGFYRTDSRNGSSGSSDTEGGDKPDLKEKADSKEKAPAAKDPGSGTDTGPAKKKDAPAPAASGSGAGGSSSGSGSAKSAGSAA